MFQATRRYVVTFLLLMCASGSAAAAVTLTSPLDLEEFLADPCATAPCSASIPYRVEYSGGFPVRRVEVVARNESGLEITQIMCFPPDPIEPGEQNPCPTAPNAVEKPTRLRAGTWTLTPIAHRSNLPETGPSILVTVREDPINIGAIVPESFSPQVINGVPVRATCPSDTAPPQDRFGCNVDSGMGLTFSGAGNPALLRIRGANLDELASLRVADNRRGLEVFLAPIPFQEPVFEPNSGIRATDWCLSERLEFEDAEFRDDEIAVKLPTDFELRWRSECGISPRPLGLGYSLRWRVVLRDRLINPGHPRPVEWLAIPSPRRGAVAQDHPHLEIDGPDFPELFGYEFDNEADDGNYKEFTSVYGDNAYICLGGFGVCATRIPDPIYHTLGFGLYKLAISITDGTCVGMSSSSQLVFDNKMSLDDYDVGPQGLFPIQIQDPDGNQQLPGVRNDYDTDFAKRRSCSPVCGGYVPDNLWARIRQLHGRQISREYLTELLLSIGSNFLNTGELGSLLGAPSRTLSRIANDPSQFVVCTMKIGGGHCVTPYAVEGNRIRVYDNNDPGNSDLFIQVNGDTYEFERLQANGRETETGSGLYAFPVDTLDGAVKLYGLADLLDLDGEAIDFLQMIVAGGASMSVEDSKGGRWGPQEDGTFVDTYPGAITLPMAGGLSIAEGKGPLLVPVDGTSPNLLVRSDGEPGIVHFAHRGKLFQVRTGQSDPGQIADVAVEYGADGRMAGFSMRPDSRLADWTPRIGMTMGESESVVAAWEGVRPRAGTEVAFSADSGQRAFALHNRSGDDAPHMLVIDHASGLDETFGRTLFGPLVTPAGAVDTAILTGWPNVDTILLETDTNGDGIADESRTVVGFTTSTPLADERAVDLGVDIRFDTLSGQLEARYQYVVEVFNQGPDTSTNVVLALSGPQLGNAGSLESTDGVCELDSGMIHCDFPDMAQGESVEVEFELIAATNQRQRTTAIVFGDGEDVDESNNQASVVAVVDAIFAAGFE